VNLTTQKIPARILLVDDHPLVLFGMEAALHESDEFRVVATAETGHQALEVLAAETLDLVLLDLCLPDLSGLDVLLQIKNLYPAVKVVMVSSSPAPPQLLDALRLGADGFLAKDSNRQLLRHGLSCALAGGSVLSSQLMQDCLAHRGATVSAPATDQVQLKPRELEVLRLVAQGKSNRVIGEHLSLAEVTVKKYLQGILDKFGVNDRTQAAMHGVRLGLIEAGV
jgi:two-component system, NarL family, response regulator LiaR